MNPRVEKLLKLPLYQRALILGGVLALVVAGFIYLLYIPQMQELETLRKENAKVFSKLQEDRRIASDLPRFKAEYEKMKVQLDQALTELPNQKEIPTLLTSITTLAKENGLEVIRFRPGGEREKGFYAEVPVELQFSGTYHQLGMFFYDIGNLSRIVNMGDLNLSSPKGEGGETLLTVKCQATTFRFVEQKPEAKSKGKKKK